MMSSPEVAGLLYKKRGGFGKMMPNAWQYRFVAITKEGSLLYFDTENADAEFDISKARGRLDLKSIPYDYSIDPIEGAPTNYSIQIGIPNEEKWKLCADTKEIQAKWCKVLDKFMVDKVVSKSIKVSTPVIEDEPQRKSFTPTSPTHTIVTTPKELENNALGAVTVDHKILQAVSIVNSDLPQNVETVEVIPPAKIETTGSAIQQPIVNSMENFVPQPKSQSHPKKRLKLAAKKNIIEQEWIEWCLVVLVVNISILGVCTAHNILLKIVYIGCCNYVIGYTLNLRFLRTAKCSAHVTVVGAQTDPGIQQFTAVALSDAVSVGKNPTTEEKNNVINAEPLVENTSNETSGSTVVRGQVPVAGCTYIQSSIDPKLSPPHTWCRADHRQFSVRVGPDYNRYKKKAPSGSPIYEPFAVDVFCAKQRVDHAATRFQLPDTSHINTNHPHVPPIFVVQIQIPSEPPTSFFSSSEDGPGWAVVMYFKITEDACNQLKDLGNASPAIKLFAEWCEKAPIDPAWRGRFKVINSCTNMEELGFPSMIVSYNAKPVLIRRTGTIFKGSNYLEMDIHVHKFANVAKQSIYLISSRCGVMFMQIGFVIEGREDKELPETLFACVAVNRPQEDQAEFIFDD